MAGVPPGTFVMHAGHLRLVQGGAMAAGSGRKKKPAMKPGRTVASLRGPAVKSKQSTKMKQLRIDARLQPGSVGFVPSRKERPLIHQWKVPCAPVSMSMSVVHIAPNSAAVTRPVIMSWVSLQCQGPHGRHASPLIWLQRCASRCGQPLLAE